MDAPARNLSPTAHWGEPGDRPPSDAIALTYHDSADRQLLLSGQVRRIPAGHLAMLWTTAAGHWLGEKPPAMWASVPLDLMLGWQLDAEWFERLLAGELLLDRPRPGDDRLARQWAEEMDSGDAAGRASRLELQARLLRFDPQPVDTVASDDSAVRLAGLLAAHHAEDVSIAQLCERAGLNSNYAAGLFKKAFGLGPQQQLTRHRLATAKRLLLLTDKPATEIASASGFGSSTRFYGAFAEQVGEPPLAWREKRQLANGLAR